MGFILATIVFLPISALPEEQLLSWGWRIPFFLSAVVVAVGFWVRRSLPETPAFEKEASAHETPKLPIADLFRTHTPEVLRVVFAALVSVVSTIFGIFVLSYAVNTMHIPRTTMLTCWSRPTSSRSVRFRSGPACRTASAGRPVFMIGALGSAVCIWPALWAISRGDIALIFVTGVLLSGIVYSAANGIWPSLYGEMFDTRVRLSGMAIGTQIGFALGGFAPTISAAIQGEGPNGWMPVAALVSAACIISAISAFSARETYNVPMEMLGKKPSFA
jgi:MFS family permease